MKRFRLCNWPAMAVLACGLSLPALTGCQTTIGGQTLPSPTYLRDDVQYFPAGDEFLLPNQARVLEEYRVRQEAIEAGLDQPLPPIVPGGPPAALPGGPNGAPGPGPGGVGPAGPPGGAP